MQAEMRICVGTQPSCENCLSKRVGGFVVTVSCLEGDCGAELKKLVDELNEEHVRRLQVMCRGAGGCVEVIVRDGELCCPTRLRDMPGISSLIDALRPKGAVIEVSRGTVILCASLDEGLAKAVERIRDAFLLLDSVYDMQRRIAEGVAKSIMLANKPGSKGGGAERGKS